MTSDAFTHWLAAMKAAGLATSDAHCGRQLGLSDDTVVRIKRGGADVRTALACQALLYKLKPYT